MLLITILLGKKKTYKEQDNGNRKIMNTRLSSFFFLFLNFYPCKENFARIS